MCAHAHVIVYVQNCECMLGCMCICMCSCVWSAVRGWRGLKWIPSRWLFYIPPAWSTKPLCFWLMALWDSCYPRAEGWSLPTFSFRAEMVNSCYLVSLCMSWAPGSLDLSSWECECYVPLTCLFALYLSYLKMYQKVFGAGFWIPNSLEELTVCLRLVKQTLMTFLNVLSAPPKTLLLSSWLNSTAAWICIYWPLILN